MGSKKIISQREARAMKKRLVELEQVEERRRTAWASEYPGGKNFWSMGVAPETKAALGTAISLSHAIVVRLDGDRIRFFALPVAAEAQP